MWSVVFANFPGPVAFEKTVTALSDFYSLYFQSFAISARP